MNITLIGMPGAGKSSIGLKGRELEDIYKQRHPLYEKYADFTVKISRNSTIDDNVDCIIRYLPGAFAGN